MKKVLFLILCCAVFAVGCNKAAEVPAVAETEQVEAVSSDVIASTDTVAADVAASTETMSQGEVK
ncbi:MAG: hypothetical protein PHH62_01885 [Endomicrobiaceae bacterium]|nr:hypothetical protein [Endomicrobiaceae bacterium]